jgi:DnaJ-class molecular chaperone
MVSPVNYYDNIYSNYMVTADIVKGGEGIVQGFNILRKCHCEGAQRLKQSLITRVDLKQGIASAAKLALRNEGNAASQ